MAKKNRKDNGRGGPRGGPTATKVELTQAKNSRRAASIVKQKNRQQTRLAIEREKTARSKNREAAQKSGFRSAAAASVGGRALEQQDESVTYLWDGGLGPAGPAPEMENDNELRYEEY